MFILFFKCNTHTTAESIVSQVESGSLWSVSMGTTSKASSYSNWCLIECTATRCDSLLEAEYDKDDIDLRSYIPVDSFTEADQKSKMWYLRGKLD